MNERLINKLKKLWIFFLVYAGETLAVLPSAPEAEDGNNYIETGGDWVATAFTYGLNFVMAGVVAVFVIVMAGRYSEAKKEQKWGDLGTSFVFGLVIVVTCLFLIDQVKDTVATPDSLTTTSITFLQLVIV